MRSAWLRRSSMPSPSAFPVAESSDRTPPSGGRDPTSSRDRSRLPGVVGIPTLPCVAIRNFEGGAYGRCTVHRVTHETGYLHLHETCERERGRGALRPSG